MFEYANVIRYKLQYVFNKLYMYISYNNSDIMMIDRLFSTSNETAGQSQVNHISNLYYDTNIVHSTEHHTTEKHCKLTQSIAT